MKGIGLTIGILTLLFFLPSCSFAPEQVPFDGKPAEFPDMRLVKTQYLLGVTGAQPITIQAEVIEVYEKANLVYIDEANFVQLNEDDEVLFSGSFGAAQVDTDTNIIKMDNGVTIQNHTDNFAIEADSLTWDHPNREAAGEDDIQVTITLKEHDILRGTGFRGDFKTATFEFSHIEEGQLHYE